MYFHTGFNRFSDDINLMLGRRLNIYWKACWMVVSPFVIGITITFNMIYYKPPSMYGNPYPGWAQTLGWLITFFPMAIIVLYFLVEYCIRGGFAVSLCNKIENGMAFFKLDCENHYMVNFRTKLRNNVSCVSIIFV